MLPEYQGKGVGKLLWKEAQRHFNAEKDIIVEVATYNTRAIRFYEHLGFIDTGRRLKNEKLKMKSGVTVPEREMIIRVR